MGPIPEGCTSAGFVHCTSKAVKQILGERSDGRLPRKKVVELYISFEDGEYKRSFYLLSERECNRSTIMPLIHGIDAKQGAFKILFRCPPGPYPNLQWQLDVTTTFVQKCRSGEVAFTSCATLRAKLAGDS